jgi:hypothetical protein
VQALKERVCFVPQDFVEMRESGVMQPDSEDTSEGEQRNTAHHHRPQGDLEP